MTTAATTSTTAVTSDTTVEKISHKYILKQLASRASTTGSVFPIQNRRNDIISYDLSGIPSYKSPIRMVLTAALIKREYEMAKDLPAVKLVQNVIDIHVKRVFQRYFNEPGDQLSDAMITIADVLESYNFAAYMKYRKVYGYSAPPYTFRRYTVRDLRTTMDLAIIPKYPTSMDARLREYAEPKDEYGKIIPDANLLTTMSAKIPLVLVNYMTEETIVVIILILKLISLILLGIILAVIIGLRRRKRDTHGVV